MVDHQKASKECIQNMKAVKDALMGRGKNSLMHATCRFIYLHVLVHQIISVKEKSLFTKWSNISGVIKWTSMHMHVYCIMNKALKKMMIINNYA